MKLLLHTPDDESNLSLLYQQAFKQAIELFVVTAYLTDWDTSLELNPNCRSFRIIVGKDFGITRKVACEAVLRWLPPKRKGQFMVADMISGFHPKAIFWRETDGKYYAIIGSSNLTRAAFQTNYEANVFFNIPQNEYIAAKKWVRSIEARSVVVSEDWLMQYKEAIPTSGEKGQKGSEKAARIAYPLVMLELPLPKDSTNQINNRRKQLASYRKHRSGLIRLFRSCAAGEISSLEFYDRLPRHWSYDNNNRLQGAGWEIRGKHSDFKLLSESFLRILGAKDDDRDDVVSEEIDNLAEKSVGTRKAFLSEMLCLEFPDRYPVLNQPVQNYLRKIKFTAPRGASEGARYIDIATKLRSSLLQNPTHPAKNLAELDTVIWLALNKK